MRSGLAVAPALTLAASEIGPTLVDEVHAHLLREPAGSGTPDRPTIVRAVRERFPLATGAVVQEVADRVVARIEGLGPLQPLLEDPDVSDVLVNGPGVVWVERHGQLERTDIVLDPDAALRVLERILAPLGRRLDRSSPVVDARLPDGSRVHAIVPPLAVDGPCIAIRRFGVRARPLGDLAPDPVTEVLAAAVRARRNIVVSGGTGAGKTTLLDALAGEIAGRERLVTIEDTAELRLPHPHVVRLEARPGSAEGLEGVDIRQLVRHALRLRPDRIIVGEVRGPEALDMLQAMNTGHEGSLGTLHANSPVDAVRRLETMVLLERSLPLGAVRDQIAATVDLIVHVARTGSAARQVVAVGEPLVELVEQRVAVHSVWSGSGPVAPLHRPPRGRGGEESGDRG
jgi:pilus assembly protein CpaF